MKKFPRIFTSFFSLIIVSFLFLNLAPQVLAVTVVLDPGHSGSDINNIDQETGLHDHDYPNDWENEEAFYIALKAKEALTKAGYKVVLTKGDNISTSVTSVKDAAVKQGAKLNASLRERAEVANKIKADMGVSIHDDHGRSWNSFAQIYIQIADGKHCRTGTKGQQCFKDSAVANKSKDYGDAFAKARTAAEGHTASIEPISFNGRSGIDPGNIPQVELYAKVPWVYNEVGAPKDGYLSQDMLNKYIKGIVDGVESSIKATDISTPGGASTSCVITKVGNPKSSPPPLPAECQGAGGGGTGAAGKCGAVIDWGTKINASLVVGGSGYDKLTKDMTSECRPKDPHLQQKYGQYWCTILIIDSYALAGIPIAENAGVVAMREWWKTAKGFKYVDYAKPGPQLKQVQPGFANLMESSAGVHTGHEHVNMIKTISVDEKGNGKITTIDANSGSKSHTYTVSGWDIKNTSYPVRGFGGH